MQPDHDIEIYFSRFKQVEFLVKLYTKECGIEMMPLFGNRECICYNKGMGQERQHYVIVMSSDMQ